MTLIAVFVIGLAGCGDAGLFAGLGERSQEYVRGDSTTTTAGGRGDSTRPTTAPGGVPVETVSWFNVGIDGEAAGEGGNVVVSAVWARGNDEGRFIQASPAEIAEALPGIEFPSVVPDRSRFVTSQLVYDAASATLDAEISAAFGVWTVEPYSEGDGRVAVLRVGQDLPDGGEGGEDELEVSTDPAGVLLAWSDGIYRYELLCEDPVAEDGCREMVESALPLEVLAPGPVVANG